MGKKKGKKVVVPADDDDELLNAAIAANKRAVEMAEIDIIAPGQFSEDTFPDLHLRCAMCGSHPADVQCGHCKQQRYCSSNCQKAAWKLQHKVTCGQPWPTPPKLARADLQSVVAVLREFGQANAYLADLCLLRLSMAISKEGRRIRLHMPDCSNVSATTAALRSLASEEPQFLEAVFASMSAHCSDTLVQNSALALLTSISGLGGSHEDSGQEVASEALARAGAFPHLVEAMLTHPKDVRIQVGGCCVLSAACRGGGTPAAARRQLALAAGVLPAVLATLSSTQPPVAKPQSTASSQISRCGGSSADEVRMSDAMMRTEAESFMRKEACAALIQLCESEEWCAATAAAGAFGIVCSLMKAKPHDFELQRHGCGLLERMCEGGGQDATLRRAVACEEGAIGVLCNLRDAVGPIKRVARSALQCICELDATRWRAAERAGAPTKWRLKHAAPVSASVPASAGPRSAAQTQQSQHPPQPQPQPQRKGWLKPAAALPPGLAGS